MISPLCIAVEGYLSLKPLPIATNGYICVEELLPIILIDEVGHGGGHPIIEKPRKEPYAISKEDDDDTMLLILKLFTKCQN